MFMLLAMAVHIVIRQQIWDVRDSCVQLKRKMSQHYIGTALFRNIGAIKHFIAYLVGQFRHTGGDLKEI